MAIPKRQRGMSLSAETMAESLIEEMTFALMGSTLNVVIMGNPARVYKTRG